MQLKSSYPLIGLTKPNQIFVFGSNLAGRHGKGAALAAHKNYGAEYGVGIGRTGMCYAIPTKDKNFVTLSISASVWPISSFQYLLSPFFLPVTKCLTAMQCVGLR